MARDDGDSSGDHDNSNGVNGENAGDTISGEGPSIGTEEAMRVAGVTIVEIVLVLSG